MHYPNRVHSDKYFILHYASARHEFCTTLSYNLYRAMHDELTWASRVPAPRFLRGAPR